jgi:hypothetical protein
MKRNKSVLQAAVASAVLLMAAGAQAGTIGTTTQNYATEIFGTGSSAIAIKPLGINYQFGVPVAANQTMYVYITLSNGAQFSAPSTTDLVCTDATLTTFAPSAATNVVTSATNIPGVVYTINTGVHGLNTNSTCNYSPSAASISGLTTSLSTAGGTVSATWTNAATLSTSAVPATGLIDAAGTHTGVILTSSTAITGTIVSSAAFVANGVTGVNETQRIAVPAEKTFTVPGAGLSNADVATKVNLGAVVFTNNPSAPLNFNGTPYTIATTAPAATFKGTVTGSFVAAGAMTLYSTADCATTTVAAGSAGVVTATTATFSTVTRPTSGVADYVCYIPGGASAIPITTPSATFTLSKTVATDIADVATGSLYPLVLNGISREVRSYIPAATTGYTTFVRLINNTANSAPVTGYFAYQDGTTSTAAPITFSINGAAASSTLPAGGSVTLTAAQIEASLGAPAAAQTSGRPRLIITAPVGESAGLGAELTGYSTIEAQSFILTNANGNFSDVTGAQ